MKTLFALLFSFSTLTAHALTIDCSDVGTAGKIVTYKDSTHPDGFQAVLLDWGKPGHNIKVESYYYHLLDGHYVFNLKKAFGLYIVLDPGRIAGGPKYGYKVTKNFEEEDFESKEARTAHVQALWASKPQGTCIESK